MRFEPGYLFGMALQCIPEPRKVAAEVQALRFSRAALWQTFALFVILSTGIGLAASMLFPVDPAQVGALLANPSLMGVIEASVLVITIFAIYWVGHALGGTGRFDQAILTVIWLQFVMLFVQLAVLALALFAPGMALLMNVFGVSLTFWILSHFIAEMHEFRSTGLVFVMIVVTMLGLLLGLSIIMAVIGVGATGPGIM